MMNKKSDMNPVFRLENSEFPGIDELTDTAKRFIYLNFENVQKEMDGEDENCNFDYKGVINITSNKFEYCSIEEVHPSLDCILTGSEVFHPV